MHELNALIDAAASATRIFDAPSPYGVRYDVPNRAGLAAHLSAAIPRAGGLAIPRIIHQIWIGHREPPWEWIDTFRRDFTREFPEWEYRLWREAEIARLDLINAELYASEPEYCGKSDFLRYELLYQFGGIYIDADTRWLNHKPLDTLRFLAGRNAAFAAWENDSMVANGVLGSAPRHPLLRWTIALLGATYAEVRQRRGWPPWVASGPWFLTQALAEMPITRFPGWYFYPVSWHGVAQHIDTTNFRDSYMIQYGYTTNGYDRDP